MLSIAVEPVNPNLAPSRRPMTHEPQALPNPPEGDPVVLATLADAEPGLPSASRGRPWATRATVLALLALVLGPVLVLGLPDEIAHWYEAAAVEQYLDGNVEGAEASLEQSLHWQPDSISALQRRARWRLEAKEYEDALADVDRVLELAPRDPAARQLRAEALQHLGRHPEAIALWESLAKSWPAADVLNGLAYARAVGNTDLDAALADINRALAVFDSNQVGVAQAAMLDTRGYIQLLRNQIDEAGADLDVAVEVVERLVAEKEKSRDYPDRRQFLAQLKRERQNLAVIRYHRALLNDRRGQPAESEQDRRRVRELGFEPNDDLF